MVKKRYVFDIDGTICTNTNGKYGEALPMASRIQKVNNLFDAGHDITFHTARGMGSSNNNPLIAYSKWYSLTERQLSEWGVKYHLLVMGKPAGEIYIDDKGIVDEEFFRD